MKEAREFEERIRGPEHSNIALHRKGLGARLIADDEFEAAIELRKGMLVRSETPDALERRHHLLGRALQYVPCGCNLEAAVHHLQTAVDLTGRIGSVTAPSDQVSMLYDLGFALMACGHDHEALQVLSRGYEDARRLHGDGQVRTLRMRRTLAFTLGFTGSFAAAIEHLRACLQHPRFNKASVNSALGVQFFYLGQFDEAVTLFETAVSRSERVDVGVRALYHSNLARCLLELGRTEAAAYLEVATAITSKLPLNHVDRLRDRHVAALLLGNDRSSVLELQRLVVDASTTLHGKHRVLAMYYHDLSEACLRQHELVLAESYARRALHIDLARCEESWQAARDRITLAEILEQCGRLEEAVDQLQRAVAPYVATFGPEHRKVASLERKVAALQRFALQPSQPRTLNH